MFAVRANHAFDGEDFRAGGATVLVQDGGIVGVEPVGYAPPSDCELLDYGNATVLPGLIDSHVSNADAMNIAAKQASSMAGAHRRAEPAAQPQQQRSGGDEAEQPKTSAPAAPAMRAVLARNPIWFSTCGPRPTVPRGTKDVVPGRA